LCEPGSGLLTSNEELLAKSLIALRLAAPTIDQFAAAYMLENIKDDYMENARRNSNHVVMRFTMR
jgi:hypothetical protein